MGHGLQHRGTQVVGLRQEYGLCGFGLQGPPGERRSELRGKGRQQSPIVGAKWRSDEYEYRCRIDGNRVTIIDARRDGRADRGLEVPRGRHGEIVVREDRHRVERERRSQLRQQAEQRLLLAHKRTCRARQGF
jgi:hypothetical protein